MQRARIARLICIVALVASTVLIPLAVSVAAQKSAGGQRKTPRLPNYYAKVASGQQQTELRAVMKQFAPKIQAKRKELQELIGQRDAALGEILTPEQLQEIAKLRAAAAQRRKAAGKGKAGEAKADGGKAKKAA